MRRISLRIVAVTLAGMALAACTNPQPAPPTAQSQAPATPVNAGFGNTPVNAGFGDTPVTGGFHRTPGAPTTQP